MSDIQSLIERHIVEGGFTGAALVVAQNGKIVSECYAGEAKPNTPVSPITLFPIASISKVYAATAIVRLIEQGELTANTPVHHVLPKFIGERREEVRLRHLLTHTSGMIYESPEMEARLIAKVSLDELIEEAYGAPLLFAPGSQLSYADYNTLIAGHMAEVATGRKFKTLVQELVLHPADLRETHFPPTENEFHKMPIVRGVMAEGTEGAMYNSVYARTLGHPAFGVVATAKDLARFGMTFLPSGKPILTPVGLRAMTTDQTGRVGGAHPSMKSFGDHPRIPWGLGWSLQTESTPTLFSEFASNQTFGHGGASGCQIVVDPLIDTVVALCTNTHVRTGRDRWYRRLQSIINVAFAAFS
jgi:CubicO group peptidase (beta-lactamase class C family)